jgi:hypothetical protein
MSEINYFKILLLYKMIWQMMLNRCWYDLIGCEYGYLNVKRISLMILNELVYIVRVDKSKNKCLISMQFFTANWIIVMKRKKTP